MSKRVVITGAGIVSAIGNNKSEVLDALLKEHSGIGLMQYLDSEHRELPVGEVKLSNAEMKSMLGIEQDRIVSRTALMGALAIRQAAEEAGIENLPSSRIVVINGTTVGGMDVTERYFQSMKTDDQYLPLILHHDCGSSTMEMIEIAGIHAECCTISTACSAALNAVMVGAEMLENDEADIVIAGGSEALSKFHLNGFNTLMILDKERCRPFDTSRAGLNLGEGSAFLVLTRGDKYSGLCNRHFTIEGYGNACDAFHQTATSDEGTGAFLAMEKALATAGLEPSDIDYVNAHGTGTPNNDITESAALMRIFGSNMPPVSSTKSFTGHTTSASGAIELVICMLAMEHGFIPSNLGWETTMTDGIKPSVGSVRKTLQYAMCNSFGFGGNDSSLILGFDSPEKETLSTHQDAETEIVSTSEIHDVNALDALKAFVSPMEARRMGKLLKAATLTSLSVLREAGIEKPDAIITATAFGMLENSERFLDDLCENGESLLKPTLFMQSTHNTIGSNIAIRLGCHGYNITYCQGKASLDWALRDAKRLISSGKANTVLVGVHDESTSTYNDIISRLGKEPIPPVYSKSMLLRRKK